MFRLLRMFVRLTLLLAFCATNRLALAACPHCGGNVPCHSVCRLVCEEKKVEVVCWGCQVEEFCLPGPSHPGCQHAETVCDFCDEAAEKNPTHSKPKLFVWTDWIPGCATVHTRKKLMKRTITRTVPSYKWVLEDICDQCESKLPQAPVPATASIPAPPQLAAPVKVLPVVREQTK
ncbi:MAG: hypothetical protein SFX18_05345 [Pirellulales bacterium]|nr:hypothetical protein [Pirellulales bacterium]